MIAELSIDIMGGFVAIKVIIKILLESLLLNQYESLNLIHPWFDLFEHSL